jgi:hypothetical protein
MTDVTQNHNLPLPARPQWVQWIRIPFGVLVFVAIGTAGFWLVPRGPFAPDPYGEQLPLEWRLKYSNQSLDDMFFVLNYPNRFFVFWGSAAILIVALRPLIGRKRMITGITGIGAFVWFCTAIILIHWCQAFAGEEAIQKLGQPLPPGWEAAILTKPPPPAVPWRLGTVAQHPWRFAGAVGILVGLLLFAWSYTPEELGVMKGPPKPVDFPSRPSSG